MVKIFFNRLPTEKKLIFLVPFFENYVTKKLRVHAWRSCGLSFIIKEHHKISEPRKSFEMTISTAQHLLPFEMSWGTFCLAKIPLFNKNTGNFPS